MQMQPRLTFTFHREDLRGDAACTCECACAHVSARVHGGSVWQGPRVRRTPFCSRVPGMGCVFCKKSEPALKEDVGLERDFRGGGAADRYGPDPTQARTVSSLAHIPNYNFPTQSTTPAFLDGGTIRAISGESGGLEAGTAWTLGEPGGKGDTLGDSGMAWETPPCFQSTV